MITRSWNKFGLGRSIIGIADPVLCNIKISTFIGFIPASSHLS